MTLMQQYLFKCSVLFSTKLFLKLLNNCISDLAAVFIGLHDSVFSLETSESFTEHNNLDCD